METWTEWIVDLQAFTGVDLFVGGADYLPETQNIRDSLISVLDSNYNELIDTNGNKITVNYGPDGSRHQIREIQSGGGFLSFDSPKAFFALGEYPEAASIDVEWSTGERTTVEGPFPTGSIYTVKRSPD